MIFGIIDDILAKNGIHYLRCSLSNFLNDACPHLIFSLMQITNKSGNFGMILFEVYEVLFNELPHILLFKPPACFGYLTWFPCLGMKNRVSRSISVRPPKIPIIVVNTYQICFPIPNFLCRMPWRK